MELLFYIFCLIIFGFIIYGLIQLWYQMCTLGYKETDEVWIEGNSWVDKNGNTWGKNYSKKDVVYWSRGMYNCYNCHNCYSCKDCINCRECERCKECEGCEDCTECVNCLDCICLRRNF